MVTSNSHLRAVRTWRGKVDLCMRQAHRPGEKLFVDYCGDTATGGGCRDRGSAGGAGLPVSMGRELHHSGGEVQPGTC
jgi:hypothetical protein